MGSDELIKIRREKNIRQAVIKPIHTVDGSEISL